MAIVVEAPDVDSRDATTQSLPSKTNPARKPKRKSLPQKVAKEAMMLTRRIHLYSGLFMFPWVLLYGFTGWFFNHPTYFSSDEVRAFQATDVADGNLASLPQPKSLAEMVVEEINLESFLVDGPEVVLTDNRNAHFDRYLSFTVNAEDQSHRVEIHPITGNGIVRTTLVAPTSESSSEVKSVPRNPLTDVTSIDLAENTQTMAAAKVPAVLSELGLSTGTASTGRFSSSLIFSAEVDGIPCKMTYNMGSGAVTALAEEAPRTEMSAKSFSQRLHLSRGYAPSMGTRTWWAISVDAMFISMVFWGCSGIFMWWQIKRTRLIGFLVLAASAVCAVWLVVGMHEELSTRSRGRGSGGSRGTTIATNRPQEAAPRSSQTPDVSTDPSPASLRSEQSGNGSRSGDSLAPEDRRDSQSGPSD